VPELDGYGDRDPKERMKTMDERLIETNKNNEDHAAFLFCAAVLEKESEITKQHMTHLYLSGGYVNGTNGATIRRAKLRGEYEDGYYRVFRKDKNSVILYAAEDDSASYPDTASLFECEGKSKAQVVVGDSCWIPHAQIIMALEARETFDASYLKGAEGVYDLYLKGRNIVLTNDEFSLAMAPVATQERLPGM
jgi:hypothetical protein